MSRTLLYLSLTLNLFFAWRWAPARQTPVSTRVQAQEASLTQRAPVRAASRVDSRPLPRPHAPVPAREPEDGFVDETAYDTLVKDEAENAGNRMERLRDYMKADLGFTDDEIRTFFARAESLQVERFPAVEVEGIEEDTVASDDSGMDDERSY